MLNSSGSSSIFFDIPAGIAGPQNLNSTTRVYLIHKIMALTSLIQAAFENPGTAYLIMMGVGFIAGVISEIDMLERRFNKRYLLSAVAANMREIGSLSLIAGIFWPVSLPLFIYRHSR
jgi:hypothetical protein